MGGFRPQAAILGAEALVWKPEFILLHLRFAQFLVGIVKLSGKLKGKFFAHF
jgi:hypothetical protein